MMSLSARFSDRVRMLTAMALLAVSAPLAMAASQPNDTDNSSNPPAGDSELREFCKTAPSPCRENLRVMLRRDKGEPYDMTFDLLPPPVQAGMVTVHPGETVRAVPLFENGEFSGWRAAKPDEPADVQILTIALEQMEGDTGMQARVTTNTGPALKLRMGLMRLDSDEPESTSSCPLNAGGSSTFEMWPYPVFMLLVADAKRVGDDDMVCR
jgi:hypothetical protein